MELPVYLSGPSQLFISAAPPNAEVGEHSHDAGDGIRFMVGGSIYYAGKELTAGDWMYIPQGKKYAFKAGAMGAVMCYEATTRLHDSPCQSGFMLYLYFSNPLALPNVTFR